MSKAEKFATAQIKFAGPCVGWDGKSHDVFILKADKDPDLRGEYIMVWAENGADYNLEFGEFGPFDERNFGNPDPKVRQHFTPDEASAIEQRLRSFANDPTTFQRKFTPPARFLGGVSFRPNWILKRDPEAR
jgi:hypothetical protein